MTVAAVVLAAGAATRYGGPKQAEFLPAVLAAVERLIEHREDGPVVAAAYDGARSHPVVLSRSVWHDVPDEGGRAIPALLVDCSDLEAPGDVDFRR